MNPAIERSTYVLLSGLALILLYWQWQPMQPVIWEVKTEGIYWLIMGIFALGWVVVFASTFMINHFELTGLQQIYNHWNVRYLCRGKNGQFWYKVSALKERSQQSDSPFRTVRGQTLGGSKYSKEVTPLFSALNQSHRPRSL